MNGDFFLAFGTLLAIVNPVSTAFVFNSIARKNRQELARTAAFTAAVVLIIFMFIGTWLLDFFGITIYAFRVAGGLYLSKIGFDMLAPRLRRSPEMYKNPGKEIAIIPLAIPLLSGPGAMTTVLVMVESFATGTIILAILAVSILSWVSLANAQYLNKILGHVGTNVVERILGLIVLVISVQFVFNGITGYLATL